MRLLCLFLIFCFNLTSLPAQNLTWTSFDELPQKMREEPRPILVFIHTDWCKYCAMQEKNTFSNSEIAESINDQFYALKLNAEKAGEITFLNRTYQRGSNGYHPLAELLGKEKKELIFPTTVFLSPQFQLQGRFVGLMKKDVMMEFLSGL